MHVLSVSSLKGGVGKTTVALGLASAAFSRGLRTLVIDLDTQCDATTGLGAIGEFSETSADVLQSPRHNIVHRAIVASSWGKNQPGTIDVMVGSPRSQSHDNPYPTVSEVWRLETALTKVEREYDIVIIDTPPSINGLTRTAWVASDRVLIVSEPSLFSVVATDRTIHAIEELRKVLTPRLGVLGILINRLKPAAPENEFRVNEIRERYGSLVVPTQIEERSSIQQATGSGRAIHSWPGANSQEIAGQFEEVLDFALASFANQSQRRPTRAERKTQRVSRIMRGQTLDQVLEFENQPEAEEGLES
ncbi:unannotated protein [freshwater metagenome]|uniref:Unannotated protein n=1 Tax=freshwater metagenome TaxID=449393 RepID=A0A6J7KHB7_9ZZZZ|nr:AAA family ATPase [Actinomycetota bacterium]